jgi:formylglycine-generating enzyme required for sulfatase activity
MFRSCHFFSGLVRGLFLLAALGLLSVSLWAQTSEPDRAIGVKPAVSGQGKRVALVFGNGAYLSSPLKNPPNDALSIAAVLRACGFEVTEKIDADLRTMETAVSEFGKAIGGADCALFFYAGHGLQVQGANYLVPVDAKIDAENEVKYSCMNAGLALAKMENAGCRVNIVILDACRNNPFARSWRASSEGLAQMDAARGSLIAYATAPGKLAADGAGTNSHYTESLLRHMRTPGLTAERVFKNVRADVLAATKNEQVPWENSSLVGDFYFVPKDGQLVLPIATPLPFDINVARPTPGVMIVPPPAAPRHTNTQARLALDELLEAMDKRDLDASKRVSYLKDFTKDYEGTTSADEARKKISGLEALAKLLEQAQTAYMSLAAQEGREVLTKSQADARAVVWRDYVSKYGSTKHQLAEAQKKVSYYEKWTAGPKHGDVESFDLGGGVKIEMVYIKGGSFEMGSPKSEQDWAVDQGLKREWVDDEGPVHTVELDGFWMGKFEVTNAQYRRFKSGHNSGSHEGNDLNEDSQPVVNVSWDDAKAFCEWLSSRTGRTFRLPTEAEWEYACRAGTRTARFTGDSDASLEGYANVADATAKRAWSNWTTFSWSDGHNVASPVGSFKPNPWGLYDMIGNVWEWCEDWHGPYSSASVKNPTGASSGSDRVDRGGGWGGNPSICRSADRSYISPGITLYDLGFRVALSPVR